MSKAACAHMAFEVHSTVTRLTEDDEGLIVTGYNLEVRAHCSECGEEFIFLAPVGMMATEPRCSYDGLRLNAPMLPKSSGQAPEDRAARGEEIKMVWQL